MVDNVLQCTDRRNGKPICGLFIKVVGHIFFNNVMI